MPYRSLLMGEEVLKSTLNWAMWAIPGAVPKLTRFFQSWEIEKVNHHAISRQGPGSGRNVRWSVLRLALVLPCAFQHSL